MREPSCRCIMTRVYFDVGDTDQQNQLTVFLHWGVLSCRFAVLLSHNHSFILPVHNRGKAPGDSGEADSNTAAA